MLHDVRVSYVSSKYLRGLIKPKPAKDEIVYGCYIPDENRIYVAKGRDELQMQHTLFHELKHAFDDQTQNMGEEERCDAFASMMVKYVNT